MALRAFALFALPFIVERRAMFTPTTGTGILSV
jgi:hypothetical protein